MQVYGYALTFEFDWEAPCTLRGEVQASSVSTAMRKIAVTCMKRRPKTNWRSISVVVERPGKDGSHIGHGPSDDTEDKRD
jgi:hypothetical protein